MKKPIILAILDGFGESTSIIGNAIKQAKTPFFDYLKENYPYTTLEASGKFVGLPENQIGNSEVGHLNIGAGRVVYTGLTLINQAIESGQFSKNKAILKSIEYSIKNNSTLHLIGLLSDGGVHSDQEHLFKILELAYSKGLKDVSIHVLGDGRDVAPSSIKSSLKKLITLIDKYNYQIASIQGRVFGMDRDQNFSMTKEGLEAMLGKARNEFDNVLDYIDKQYKEGITDEFLIPAINKNSSVKFIKDNEAVIIYNFRPDRMRQLSHLLIGSSLYSEPISNLDNIHLTTMMKYENIDSNVAFESMEVDKPFGEIIANNNFKQLRLAETQKYAHVTFFFDGGKEIKYPNMDTIMVPSLKVNSYATAPQMSAVEITNTLIENINNYDFIIVNYANADMVGHTGNIEATIKAIEVLDQELKRVYDSITSIGGTLFITADHGNAETMLDEDGNVMTKHSTSVVPLYITDKEIELFDQGKLSNIASTILEYKKIQVPKEINEKSLIK